MRPVTSSIDGAETSSTEDGGASRPSALPSKDHVCAAAYLACHAAAQVQSHTVSHTLTDPAAAASFCILRGTVDTLFASMSGATSTSACSHKSKHTRCFLPACACCDLHPLAVLTNTTNSADDAHLGSKTAAVCNSMVNLTPLLSGCPCTEHSQSTQGGRCR